MQLVKPSPVLLPSYVAALERGWTAESDNDVDGAHVLLDSIRRDPDRFLAALWNHDGLGPEVVLEDGSSVARLPWTRYWMSEGGYVGELNFRWQRGTSELPAYCLGHVGYAVLPWKRGSGYARSAVQQLVPIARSLGLHWIDISMSSANVASRRTAENCGATLVREFNAGAEYGNQDAVLYRLRVDARGRTE